MIITIKTKSAAFVAALQRLAVDYDLAAKLVDRLIMRSYTTQTDQAIFLVEPGRFIIAPADGKGYRIPLGPDNPPLLSPPKPGGRGREYIGPGFHDSLIDGLQVAADIFAGLEGPRRPPKQSELDALRRRRAEREQAKAALVAFMGLASA